jgi:multidrug efflux pump subunit AcrA (membrane-fusion protein)
MIDEEVEMVLREIRERVVSQPLAEPPLARPAPAPGNGDGKPLLIANADPGIRSSESLARLNAHLTTTARAWDRLPPIFSNRSGVAARIEVWIKARLKSLSRWFTWEQVNFNAAVHHALGDTLQTLANQEAAIAALRAQLAQTESEAQARRSEIELLHTEIAQLQSETAARRVDVQNQQKETNALRAELRGEVEASRIRAADQETQLRAEIETQKTEAAGRLSEVANELREREDRLENEQRVCFKQLSIETSEAVVSNDRAQRRTGARLDEMNQRIKQIEEST